MSVAALVGMSVLSCQPFASARADDAEVTRLIKQLDNKQPKKVRLDAAKRLRKICTRAKAAVPVFKRSVTLDPDSQVRVEAIKALAKIVFQNKKTRVCPIEIFQAWEDKDADVREMARAHTTMFLLKKDNKPDGKIIAYFPKQATGLLLRFAKSPDAYVRAEAVMRLGYLAENNAKAMAVIKKARTDKDWWVRHSAHFAVHSATGDLEGLLHYKVIFFSQLLDRKPMTKEEVDKLPETQRREVYRKNLLQIGMLGFFGEDAQKYPKKTADALHRLLRDESAKTRLAAVRFLERGWPIPELFNRNDFRAWVPFFADKKQKKQPQIPRGAWLRKYGLDKRLEEMSRADADAAVRKAARAALKKIADRGK